MKTGRFKYTSVIASVISFSTTCSMNCWGLFSLAVAKEFTSWTSTQLSLTYTISLTMFFFGSLACGTLRKKINSSTATKISGIMYLTGYLISANAKSLAEMYIGFGFIIGLGCGIAYNTNVSYNTMRFPEKQGPIMGILLMAYMLGGSLFNELFNIMTPDVIGAWRHTFTVFGIASCVSLFVVSFFLPEITPVEKKEQTDEKITPPVFGECDIKKIIRFAPYYYFFGIVSFTGVSQVGLASQTGAFAEYANPSLPFSAVATLSGAMLAANGLSRVLAGFLYSKVGRKVITRCYILLFYFSAGFEILALLTHETIFIVLAFASSGSANGFMASTAPTILRESFGSKSYSMNFGYFSMNSLIASIGSVLAGAMYDMIHSYISLPILVFTFTTLAVFCNILFSSAVKKAQA